MNAAFVDGLSIHTTNQMTYLLTFRFQQSAVSQLFVHLTLSASQHKYVFAFQWQSDNSGNSLVFLLLYLVTKFILTATKAGR